MEDNSGQQSDATPKIKLNPPSSTSAPRPKIQLQKPTISAPSAGTVPPTLSAADTAPKPMLKKPVLKPVGGTAQPPTQAPASPVQGTPAPTVAPVATATPPAPPAIAKNPETVTVPPLRMPSPKSTTGPIIEPPAPKTIKLKRPGTTVLKAATSASNMKKETSRVDINEALAQNLTEAAPTAPKTIKLKRPSTASVSASATGPSPQLIEQARKSETSRIELPTEATVEAPRQRKTVQIKRPGAGGTGASRMVLKPTVQTSAPDDIGDLDITIGEEDESTIVFSLISLVATLVVCVVLYVLAAQTIAPNLPWPGKLI